MAKEDEKKEDEKLTPVGDGIETSDEKDTKTEPQGEETDEKVGQSAEEDSDDEDEDAADKEGDNSLREKIRRQRRDAKKRKQARIVSDRRELEFLRRRNEAVERQLSGVLLRQDRNDVATIDTRISTLEGQIREAETIHTQAVEAKDGATATEALRVKDALRETLSSLKNNRTELVNSRKAQTETRDQGGGETSRAAHPEAVRHGKQWVEKNDWFDPSLQDDDSYLARAIEERMARSGEYDPRDPDYWEELDRRISEKLPHLKKVNGKAKDEDDSDDLWGEKDEKLRKKPEVKKSGGPRIAVGGKTRSLRPNEVHISAERKKALMEAGVWEDEEKRERYLRAYKQYDEDAARNS